MLATSLILLCIAGVAGTPQESAARVPAAGPLAGSIRVRVVDEAGEPVSGATLVWRQLKKGHVTLESGARNLWGSDWNFQGYETDTAGLARLDGIGPGPWQVGAICTPAHGYGFAPDTQAGGQVTITLPALDQQRTISGSVVAPDGTPLASKRVHFVWDDHGRMRYAKAFTGADGRFLITKVAPGAEGVLHASDSSFTYRSTATEGVRSGAHGQLLRLGEQQYLKIESVDQHGDAHPAYVDFWWQLSGHPFQDRRGSSPVKGSHGQYELPTVPFFVDVWRGDEYSKVRVGPLDPAEVGPKLQVPVHRYTRLRGRVTHRGEPAVSCTVILTPEAVDDAPTTDIHSETPFDVEMRPPKARPKVGGARTLTDEHGLFDLPIRAAATFRLRAERSRLGEVELEPMTLDPAHPPEFVELEIQPIAVRTGKVVGRVLFPPGRDASHVWISTDPPPHPRSLGTYMALAPDGTFVLDGLPPERVTIRFRQGFGEPIVALDAPRDWMGFDHGPQYPPAWMDSEPTYRVDVESDATVNLDIDLASPQTCRLEGRILLNGEAPIHKPRKPGMYGEYDPRVVLDRGRYGKYTSRCRLRKDGTFTLTAEEPGTYRLGLDIPTADEREWNLYDSIEMKPGKQTWERNFETGGLRLLPRKDQSSELHEQVRWAGPGSLRIFRRDYDRQEQGTDEVYFPVLPVGTVQVFHDAPEERVILHEVEIRAGEVTEISRD